MSKRLFVASFTSENDILAATKTVRKEGYIIHEIYTPYAVHGLDTAQGLRKSRLPFVCLGMGLFGAMAKLWFQIWTSSTSWPVNVGGKPLASVPAFVPVTFEITVLFAGLGTVAAFFFITKLRPGKKPRIQHEGATDDRFVLELVESDAVFDFETVSTLCLKHNAVTVSERIENEGTSDE